MWMIFELYIYLVINLYTCFYCFSWNIVMKSNMALNQIRLQYKIGHWDWEFAKQSQNPKSHRIWYPLYYWQNKGFTCSDSIEICKVERHNFWVLCPVRSQCHFWRYQWNMGNGCPLMKWHKLEPRQLLIMKLILLSSLLIASAAASEKCSSEKWCWIDIPDGYCAGSKT